MTCVATFPHFSGQGLEETIGMTFLSCLTSPYGDRCAPTLSPEDELRYSQEAERLFELEEFGAAADTLNILIAARPQDTHYRALRGYAAAQSGDIEESMWEFRSALAIDEFDAEVFFWRGAVKAELGDLRGALRDATEATRLDEEDPRAFQLGAVAAMQLGDLDEALAFAEAGILLAGDRCVTCFGIAGLVLTKSQTASVRDMGCEYLSRAGELGDEEAYGLIRENCQ